MDPDGLAEVKNGWIPWEGTRTEQFDLILSLLGPHTICQRSYYVISGPKLTFLRTYHDLVDLDGLNEVKHRCIPLDGTRTEQLDLFFYF